MKHINIDDPLTLWKMLQACDMYLRVKQLEGIIHLFKHRFDGWLDLHTKVRD